MYIDPITLRKYERSQGNKRDTVTHLITGFTEDDDAHRYVAAGTNNVLVRAFSPIRCNEWCLYVCGGYVHLIKLRK